MLFDVDPHPSSAPRLIVAAAGLGTMVLAVLVVFAGGAAVVSGAPHGSEPQGSDIPPMFGIALDDTPCVDAGFAGGLVDRLNGDVVEFVVGAVADGESEVKDDKFGAGTGAGAGAGAGAGLVKSNRSFEKVAALGWVGVGGAAESKSPNPELELTRFAAGLGGDFVTESKKLPPGPKDDVLVVGRLEL